MPPNPLVFRFSRAPAPSRRPRVACARRVARLSPERLYRALSLAAVLALVVGARLGAEVQLVDVTARSGVSFRHVCGSREKDWIVEVNGSGVALFDADRDGDLDVYFVNGSTLAALDARSGTPKEESDSPATSRPSNALYRNDGDWRFTDITSAAGVGDRGWGSGASVADVDGDGNLDLYVTNYGPNVLYLGRGDGRFERVNSGAEGISWSASASFGDFDRDGHVDLYVANYVEFTPRPEQNRASGSCTYRNVSIFCGPGGLEGAHDALYLGRGDGTFRNASDAWGVRAVEPSYGLGTLVVDLDRDGFLDVVVANDTRRNFAFLGGPKGFTEAGRYLGLAYNDYGVEQAGMGLASGDTRTIGRDDVFVTNFEDDSNTLYLQQPDGVYAEGTYPAKLGGPSYRQLGWGCFFFDVEGDGDLDLFVANGHVAPQVDEVRSSLGYRQANQCFVNDGKGRFREDVAFAKAEAARLESSRGAACGDLDGDGDSDVVVSHIDARPTLLENRSPAKGVRWVAPNLRGVRSDRAAIGARVTLVTNHRRREHTVQSGSSFASQCELDPRFALAPDETILHAEVRWPRGGVERFPVSDDGRAVLRPELIEGAASRQGEK